ncbi:efflux RND transporter permease subunit [Terrisporobacter mayombei]|uniref:Multidrug resistance protein MdtB n=1 Tax=Terrisporobacter mayombei TaxID=1541 RepID=A0ABY9Q533_9FIRM|nr:efflux RND transporter permease subunit [Terrisporobacter mayombei]WMT82335.1 Multidrug resistance protein MdtB [Terrisporobacter mayombei]
MLPKFSVRKPLTVFVSVIMVLMLGFVSFTKMTPDLLPSIDLPYVIAMTTYPGSSPEKIETTVTKPIEQAVSTTSGIKNVTSVSNENYSVVILEFNQDTNMDTAMLDLNGKIDLIKDSLEDGVGATTLMQLNPDMMPVMTLSMDVDNMNIEEVSTYVNNEIIPKFERINGVASVTGVGLVEKQLEISLNKDKIDELNNKLKSSVTSKLDKQQSQLNSAKSEIQNGKAALEKQSNTQMKKLLEASSQLQSGINQLESMAGILNSTGSSKEDLEKYIESATTTLNDTKLKLKELKKQLNSLPEDSTIDKEKLQEDIESLEGVIASLEKAISNAGQGISAVDSLETLKKQQKELESAKLTLSQELTKATVQLSVSESQIKSAETQLNEARKQALESADITDKITPETINQILTAENFSMPAGYISDDETEYSVKVGDKFTSINEVKNLILFSMDGIGDVHLKDIANVKMSDNSSDSYTNINGNAGVILSFQKTSTASTTKVCNEINKVIKDLNNSNNKLHILSLMDQGVYIDFIISSVLDNLIYGGILAIFVLLIFLKSIKPTIVIAFSIPISLLFSIVLMYFSGVTLNIISLSGLALGVGMLVDNSIVVIENIYRLRNKGMGKFKAAVYGARQVSGAIFASTLTTICVFLPIVFTEGITRQLFTDMGLTIAYSLIASLIVALTLVPCMASNLLSNVDEKSHPLFDKMVDGYEKLLRLCLKFKPVVLCFSVVLLIVAAFATTKIGTSFMPKMDSPQMMATINIDSDLPKEEARHITDQVVQQVLTIDDVEGIGAMDSSGPMSFGSSSNNPNNMAAYVILKDDKKKTNDEISEEIKEKTKSLNCEVTVSSSSMDTSSLGGSGLQIIVKGDDLDELKKISDDLVIMLSSIEGTTDINGGMGITAKEERIVINKNKAMKYGLTVAQVFQQVSAKLSTETTSTTLTINSEDYPVIIVNHDTSSLDKLKNVEITGTKGTASVSVKLKDISSIEMTDTPTSINHDNQTRYISVTAGIDSKHNIGLVSKEVQSKLDNYKTPIGYEIKMGGETESINQAISDLIKMIALAIAFIYLIMVAQFQSLLSPFIVMFTIPLAFTGGLLALIITGQELSVISMLGFLVLAGVVVNNGIVFVDYVNQLRISGLNKKEALIEAGRTRIRPILMTALTTILAMSTMALGVGMGAEISQALAIVTIGGLTYATLLTLFVVPTLYDIFHRRKELRQIIIDEED